MKVKFFNLQKKVLKNDHQSKHLNSLQNYDNFLKGKKEKERLSLSSLGDTSSSYKEKQGEVKKSMVSTRIMNSSLAVISVKEDSRNKVKTRSALAEERSRNLYSNAIFKIEMKKSLIKQKEEVERNKELEKCTFRPKINTNYKVSRNRKIHFEGGSLKTKEK